MTPIERIRRAATHVLNSYRRGLDAAEGQETLDPEEVTDGRELADELESAIKRLVEAPCAPVDPSHN